MPNDLATGGSRRRIIHLLGARVVMRDGARAGFVQEVRLSGGPGLQNYVVEGFVVSPRKQASLLGYDRREVLGPWLVRALVGLVNRDLAYVSWASVRRIGWDDGVIEVNRVEALREERAPA